MRAKATANTTCGNSKRAGGNAYNKEAGPGELPKDIKGDFRRALDEPLDTLTKALNFMEKPSGAENDTVSNLRRVLLSWKGASNGPKKLVYLLRTPYKDIVAKYDTLEATDKQKTALIASLAKEYGFRAGLSTVEYYEQGTSMGGYGGGNRNKWRDRYSSSRCYYDGRGGFDDSEEEDSEEEYEMEEVHETSLCLRELVGLDGKSLKDGKIRLDANREGVQSNIVDTLMINGHDEQEFDSFGCHILERWYRGIVVVVWPLRYHLDLIHGARTFKIACDTLEESFSDEPTDEEREMVEIILARGGPNHTTSVVRSVCHAALNWRDTALWQRAVRACDADRAISELESDNALNAVLVLGFDAVKPCFESVLKRDPDSIALLEFLDTFYATIDLDEDEDEYGDDDQDMREMAQCEWIVDWQKKILGELKILPGHGRYTKEKVAACLVSASINVGDAEVIEKIVFPQLQNPTHANLLFALAREMHASTEISANDKICLVHDALSAAVTHTDFYTDGADVNGVELSRAAIVAALTTDNPGVTSAIVAKLTAFEGLDIAVVRQRITTVVLPLVVALGPTVKGSSAASVPALETMREKAIQIVLDDFAATPQDAIESHALLLLDVVATCSDVDQVLLNVISKLSTLSLPPSLVGSLFNKLGLMKGTFNTSPLSNSRFDSSLMLLADKYAKSVCLTASAASKYPCDKEILQVLERMIRHDASSACAIVFIRYLAECDSNSLEESLITVVPSVIKWLTEHDRKPTGGYATMCRAIFMHWVDKTMGAQPDIYAANSLLRKAKKWTCYSHKSCASLRDFFFDGKAQSKMFDFFSPSHTDCARNNIRKLGLGSALAFPENKRRGPQSLKASGTSSLAGYSSLTPFVSFPTTQVEKQPAFWAAQKWQMRRDQAAPWFKTYPHTTLSDMRRILEGDAPRVFAAFEIAMPAEETNAAAASAVPITSLTTGAGPHQSNASAAGVRNLAHTSDVAVHASAPANTLKRTAETELAAPASVTTSTSSAPPAKRQKVACDEKDVIDLTGN